MTFPANNPGAAVIGDYNEIAALHGATKTSVDAATAKLEAMRLLLVAIGGYEDGVEGFVDGLEALMGTNNVALGAPGDAAWTTGNGSTIALLKAIAGLTTATNTAIAATNTLLGDTTTPAPITATQLPSTIGRKASSNSLSVTFASDIDSENHLGGVTGYSAVITGSVTRPADTVAYSVGDLVANNTTAASVTPVTLAVARINDGTGSIRRIRLSTTKTGNAGTEVFRVHLFKTSPTVANGDNGVFSANGVTAIHIGYVDVTLDRVFSDGAKGIGVPAAGGEITFDPATGTKNVFALLEARSAYTPISGEVFTIALELFRD